MNPLGGRTLSAIPEQAVASPSQPTQQPVQDPWYTKILPTIGGIGGGILGEMADPFGGGIVGAAAGGALGKGLENGLTGQDVGKGVVSTALLSGAGQGVGDIASGVLGGLASKGANVAEGTAAKLFAGQAPKGAISPEVAQDIISNHGISNLGTASKFSDIVTGGTAGAEDKALVTKAVEDGVLNNGPGTVDLSAYRMGTVTPRNESMLVEQAQKNGNLVQQAITDNGLNREEGNQVRSLATAAHQAATQGADVGGGVDSLSALNFQRQLANEAGNNWQAFINSGRSDASSQRLYKAFGDLSNNVKSSIGLQNIAVPQEIKDSLSAKLQQYGSQISQKGADTLSNRIQDANTYADLRGIESDYVGIKKAAQAASDAEAKNFGTSAQSVIAGVGAPIMGGPKGVAAGLVGAGVKNSTTNSAIAKGLTTASDLINSPTAQKVLPTLIKATTVAGANLPNDASPAGSAAQPQSGTMAQGATMNPVNNVANPYSPDFMATLIHQATVDPYLASSILPTIAALAPQYQKTGLASSAMASLLPAYQNAGGAAGGGPLNALSAILPGSAQQAYQQQAGTTAGLLGSAGIPGGSGLLPSLFQSGNVAQQRESALQAILASLGGGSALPSPQLQ